MASVNNYEGCMTIPTFNFPDNKKPIFCKEHALKGMENKKVDFAKNAKYLF